MDIYDQNIKELKKQGFVDTNFAGYGATIFKKGEIEIYWGEWGNVFINKFDEKKAIGQISTELIKEKLLKAINDINWPPRLKGVTWDTIEGPNFNNDKCKPMDNPAACSGPPNYLESLKSIDEDKRKLLLEGNWNVECSNKK